MQVTCPRSNCTVAAIMTPLGHNKYRLTWAANGPFCPDGGGAEDCSAFKEAQRAARAEQSRLLRERAQQVAASRVSGRPADG